MKIGFFEVRDEEKEFLENNLKEHQLFFFEQEAHSESLPTDLDIEIVSTHTASRIDRKLMDKLPNLKLITTRTTGFNHIDLEVAKEKNITVCSVPNYGENTVAEFAFALILNISRQTFNSINRLKTNKSFDLEGLRGFDLKGKTLGVVGTGNIGRHAIKIAEGFEMEVIAFDAYPNEQAAKDLGYEYKTLEEVLADSDIITLHVPSLPSTNHMINKDSISKMKKGVAIVNTARGDIINTSDLIEGLKNGQIGAVGLDVLETEGIIDAQTEELLSMDNVYLTPHNAFHTKEAVERILQTTVDNINAFLAGTPQNLVKN